MLHSIGKCSTRASMRGRYGSFSCVKSSEHVIRRGIFMDTPQPPAELHKRLADSVSRTSEDAYGQIPKEHSPAPLASLPGSGKKMYILPMFPYPSGDLHLGHLRVYTISDVLARFRRMQGYQVMHPIGWDAFGLPAENAAIARGIDPAVWTKQNISKMKSQLKVMNGQWNWSKEFATCDPTFYKHTQSLFLLLHQKGLAYQAESLVNYDPIDKTVLANEQVDASGRSWRSGAKVEKKMLKQWFFKISAFREELLNDLDLLAKDGAWPERILTQQKNWLGKSTGARIKFQVVDADDRNREVIEVFTTRPDTLFGVQYIAVAAGHPLVQEAAKGDSELQDFLAAIPNLPEGSKKGYLLCGFTASNPLVHDESTPLATKAPLPIYVAPYVLQDYGDGAVMGVPGHDSRDHEFWKVNQPDTAIRMVVGPLSASETAPKTDLFLSRGKLTSFCGRFSGQTTSSATENLLKYLQSENLGVPSESWRLRDWLISRQRYWGTPIPIIHCNTCGPVPVPVKQLPVELPSVKSHWEAGKVGNPLEHAHDWINTTCPECHGPAKRDTDTMDTFVDSSWYFMRFLDPDNHAAPFSTQAADDLLPVDVYIGGVEHAILHLLYARFISKFISTTDLWHSACRGEPFRRVLAQGMVHGKTYTDPSTGRFLKPDEVDLRDPHKPVVVASGEIANISFEKMSKSKFNGVDPTICMAKHGVDATRAHILFQAPVSEILEWDEEKIAGITRWLNRIKDHILAHHGILYINDLATGHPPHVTARSFIRTDKEFVAENEKLKDMISFSEGKRRDVLKISKEILANNTKLWRAVQNTIGSVTQSYGETYSLNTVVSDLMSLTNALIEHSNIRHDDGYLIPGKKPYDTHVAILGWRALLQMMAPITPAFSEEMWQILNTQRREFTFPKSDGFIDKNIYSRGFMKYYYNWKYASDSRGLRELVEKTDKKLPQDMIGRLMTCPPRFRRTYVVKSKIESIFDVPFPQQDGTLEELEEFTQKCAVQVNGKLKFVVEIDIPEKDLSGNQLETWVVNEIIQTREGTERLTGRMDVKNAKKIIVIKRGKGINFVM